MDGNYQLMAGVCPWWDEVGRDRKRGCISRRINRRLLMVSAMRVKSSTLMDPSADANACSACASAGITTCPSSGDALKGSPFISSTVPAARRMSSAETFDARGRAHSRRAAHARP